MGRVRSCTRRLAFDSGHRVMRHESKCKNLHGHRYVADVTCAAKELDDLGRVVDFSVIKTLVGGFVDEYWDHGLLVNHDDRALIELAAKEGWRLYVMPNNPTAENLAEALFNHATKLLGATDVEVLSVRIYETPNCWADFP